MPCLGPISSLNHSTRPIEGKSLSIYLNTCCLVESSPVAEGNNSGFHPGKQWKKGDSIHLWLLPLAIVIPYHRVKINAGLVHKFLEATLLFLSCRKPDSIGLAICDSIPQHILTLIPLWWLLFKETKKARYKWLDTNDRSPRQGFFIEESDKKMEVSWIIFRSSFLPCCLM